MQMSSLQQLSISTFAGQVASEGTAPLGLGFRVKHLGDPVTLFEARRHFALEVGASAAATVGIQHRKETTATHLATCTVPRPALRIEHSECPHTFRNILVPLPGSVADLRPTYRSRIRVWHGKHRPHILHPDCCLISWLSMGPSATRRTFVKTNPKPYMGVSENRGP